ncbi:hypothetical protein K2X05_05550 [bacterium]|jgi:hypothetical protein|nr:hypothetical protein [bacterium]
MKKTVFFFLFGVLLNGCESAGTGDPVDIPDVIIDCQNGKCTGVATGSYEVTINITSSGCADDQIPLAPVVAGTANITCTNGVGCSGTVSTWRDNNSSITSQIPSSTYSVCGTIDLDRSLTKNPGDAYADESRLVTASFITLSDWDAQNERTLRRASFR